MQELNFVFQYEDDSEKSSPSSSPEASNDKDKDKDEEWMSKKSATKGSSKNFVKSHATLIVCPASLVHQWGKEIERRCDEGTLSVVMYHGPNREKSLKKLARADVVLTTYNIISKEVSVSVFQWLY